MVTRMRAFIRSDLYKGDIKSEMRSVQGFKKIGHRKAPEYPDAFLYWESVIDRIMMNISPI